MSRPSPSFEAAVADGTISEEAASRGLSETDVIALATRHPKAMLLVRMRSERGDARVHLTAAEVASWSLTDRSPRADLRPNINWDLGPWSYSEIRDVYPVQGDES
jgi:hypothetical protein